MARRRNRVRGLEAIRAWVVSAGTGLVVGMLGMSPTGGRGIDFLMTAGLGAAYSWACASTPALGLVIASSATVVAGVVFISPISVLVGGVALALSLTIRQRHENWPWARSLVGSLGAVSLAFLGGARFLGAATIVALLIAVPTAVFGVRRRPRNVRAWVIRLSIAAAVLMVGSAVAGGVAAWRARTALNDAVAAARVAQRLVNTGDIIRATEQLRIATSKLKIANEQLTSPLAQTARLVPIVAQHKFVLTELTNETANQMLVAADALSQFDPSRLTVTNGAVDLASIRGLETPIVALQTALIAIDSARREVTSPWLVPRVSDLLAEFGTDMVDFRDRTDFLLRAVRVMPAMLGADEPRRYFVALTTPAESRGLGGFMGAFAEVTVTAGRFQVTRVDNTGALNLGGKDPAARTLTGPDYFLANYGPYGFNSGPNGATAVEAWSNITMAPDFPTVAQVIAELYPQSGGAELDGVFLLDVYGLAGMMQMTGPVVVPGLNEDINAGNLPEFLLVDQYLIDDFFGEPSDSLLRRIADATFDAVMQGVLPGPVDMARILGPYVDEGRILGFSTRSEEQTFLTEAGMDGSLPLANGSDGFMVAVNNAAPNKIDRYLARDISYEAVYNPATGSVSGVLEVALTNTAPRAGLPAVVLDNAAGYPRGTARELVMIYTQLPIVTAQVDESPISVTTIEELGWYKSTVTMIVPPNGGRSILTLTLAGTLNRGEYSVLARPQPMTLAEQVEVKVNDPTGRVLVDVDVPLKKTELWTASKFALAGGFTDATAPVTATSP